MRRYDAGSTIGGIMKTPIFDFVKNYNDQNQSRFHMPGHKGVPFLGCEPLDITEIDKFFDYLGSARNRDCKTDTLIAVGYDF